jgi:hypothetical protein
MDDSKANAVALIERYYRTVDASTALSPDKASLLVDEHAVRQIIDMFSEDANYLRDRQLFKGKPFIERFFAKERDLCGTHSELEIYAVNDDNTVNVTVKGVFSGTQCKTAPSQEPYDFTRSINESSETTIDFIDHWHIANGKVAYRHSELSPRERTIELTS